MLFNPISVVEAAYRVDASTRDWLERLALALGSLTGAARASGALLYETHGFERVRVVDVVTNGLPEDVAAALLGQSLEAHEASSLLETLNTRTFWTLRSARLPARLDAARAHLFERLGADDIVCLNARDPGARSCLLAVAVNAAALSPQAVRTWQRVAAHLTAAARLRRKLSELDEVRSRAPRRTDALEEDEPRGRATGGTRPRGELRERLAELHRTRSRRASPEQAFELREGLVAGHWSLLEHFERDGKRYYLACRNEPELGSDRALSPREREILGLMERGHSNKLIAATLGLSLSAVSTALTRAHRKLRVSARG
ncbi:MAG TPA: helix-turn-helix transcriptional regulator [Polyangiaceae bacterium]